MATRKQQLDFLARVIPAAQASQAKYGIPASVTIAQAILESGWGASKLAITCNNYFGIKARIRDGKPIEDYADFRTTEYFGKTPTSVVAKFRKFRSTAECFVRHAELIGTSKRYRPAMAVTNDPLAFALQLQLCGYCTDPDYASDLAGLIRQWDLTQYDNKPKEAA